MKTLKETIVVVVTVSVASLYSLIFFGIDQKWNEFIPYWFIVVMPVLLIPVIIIVERFGWKRSLGISALFSIPVFLVIYYLYNYSISESLRSGAIVSIISFLLTEPIICWFNKEAHS